MKIFSSIRKYKKYFPHLGIGMFGLMAVLASIAIIFSYTQDQDRFLSAQIISQPVPQLLSNSGSVRMLAFGDLMLDRDLKRLMNRYGNNYPFEKIAGKHFEYFRDYDIVHANLEGAIFEDESNDLSMNFAFDPKVVPDLLRRFRFNLVNLANNHTYDKGEDGWRETLETLHSNSIDTVGNSFNNFDFDVLEKEYNGISIGFIGLHAITEIPLNWEEAFEKIRLLNIRNDFVVVFAHWGVEYNTLASNWQEQKAHELVWNGADIIIGTHPHVIQQKEQYEGKWIYYSLGNFVFDQYFSQKTQEGLALDITFKSDGDIDVREKLFDIVMGQPMWRN